jgi:hypothetical protein
MLRSFNDTTHLEGVVQHFGGTTTA